MLRHPSHSRVKQSLTFTFIRRRSKKVNSRFIPPCLLESSIFRWFERREQMGLSFSGELSVQKLFVDYPASLLQLRSNKGLLFAESRKIANLRRDHWKRSRPISGLSTGMLRRLSISSEKTPCSAFLFNFTRQQNAYLHGEPCTSIVRSWKNCFLKFWQAFTKNLGKHCRGTYFAWTDCHPEASSAFLRMSFFSFTSRNGIITKFHTTEPNGSDGSRKTKKLFTKSGRRQNRASSFMVPLFPGLPVQCLKNLLARRTFFSDLALSRWQTTEFIFNLPANIFWQKLV